MSTFSGEPHRAAYWNTITALEEGNEAAGRNEYERFRKRRTDLLARRLYEWINQWESITPTDPSLQPARQIITPSQADLIRERGWPTGFTDQVLALTRNVHANSQGQWILWRVGKGKERSRVTNQVRLNTAATTIRIGCRTPLWGELAHKLVEVVPVSEDDRPYTISIRLNPHDEQSARALQILRSFVPQ